VIIHLIPDGATAEAGDATPPRSANAMRALQVIMASLLGIHSASIREDRNAREDLQRRNADAIDAKWLCVDKLAARSVTTMTYQKRPAFLVATIFA
jgi:hypothetical protein